jgi:G6PDH family F420-dependent oxidoreductase
VQADLHRQAPHSRRPVFVPVLYTGEHFRQQHPIGSVSAVQGHDELRDRVRAHVMSPMSPDPGTETSEHGSTPARMRLGYFLSCEEHDPESLLQQARMAEDAGFEALWISDHFHPWNDEQGSSPFVWSVIGGLSQVTSLPVTTAVTCPTMRIHPALVAQAAATAAVMTGGRFRLGLGSGEALNEHVVGARWPTTGVRLAMLEEAIEVIRALFTGDDVYHHGEYYTVEDARLYTRPTSEVPIYVSGFGPKAIDLAARVGDGFITTQPNGDHVQQYRSAGGTGPVEAGTKFCWSADAAEGVRTAHRLWANESLPGELAQILSSPKHFEQASELVTEEMVASSIPTGPDLEPYLKNVAAYADAGVDTLYVNQIGPEQEEFFRFAAKELLPAWADQSRR